jgi:hypothetical protein
MSKTGQWVYEMQEDSWSMPRQEWIEKHGESHVDVWDTEHEKAKEEFTSEEINQMYMKKGI